MERRWMGMAGGALVMAGVAGVAWGQGAAGVPATIPATIPATAPASGPASGPASAPATAPATATARAPKAAVPAAAEQARALKEIQDVYGTTLTDRRPEARYAAVRKLAKDAAQTPGTGAVRFVLYQEACRLAAEMGDIDAALGVIDDLSELHAIDANAWRLEAAEAAAPRATRPEDQREIAQVFRSLAEDAVDRDDYPAAIRLANKAAAAAGASKDTVMAGKYQRRVGEIIKTNQEYTRTAAARKTLAAQADDAEANGAVGSFLCLMKGAWDAGLPHLAKGDDAELQPLAAAELAEAADAAGVVALADRWWAYAEKADPLVQKQCRLHAADLYREALPELAGFPKEKAQARLDKVEAEYGSRDSRVANLLAAIRPAVHVRVGTLEATPQGVVMRAAAVGTDCLADVPVRPEGDYEVAIQFTAADAGQIVAVMPVGQRQAGVVLTGHGVFLQQADGGALPSRGPEVRQACRAAMRDRKAHVLMVKVSVTGEKASVEVRLDRQLALAWSGKPDALAAHAPWQPRLRGTLGLGSQHGTVVVKAAALRMTRG